MIPAPCGMPDATAPVEQVSAASPPRPEPPSPSLRTRIARVLPYVRDVRRFWLVVLLATLVGAATEPMVPALLKPLLDRGFQKAGFNAWQVPVFLLAVFGIRGTAGFIADVALARIANQGMLNLREALFARLL